MDTHLNRLTELICLWTPDGRLSACNDAYCEFFGASRDALIGRRWIELLPEAHQDASAEFLQDFVARPRPDRRERPARRATGEMRWLDWIHQPVLDASGRLVEVISEGRDITERKRAEQAAHQSEQRYHQLFDEAMESMILVDPAAETIEDCNRAFLALTGFDRGSVVGHPLPLAGGGLPEGARLAGQLSLGDPAGAPFRCQLKTRAAAPREVDIRASLVQFGARTLVHALIHDVTERREAARYRDATLVLLRLLNEQDQTREFLRQLTLLLRQWTGCQGVGVRLRDGDDFPFSETLGLSADFVRRAQPLARREPDGRLALDADGAPLLDCLCGRATCATAPTTTPGLSPRGTWWSNQLGTLVATGQLARGCCAVEKFESLALVPLRRGDEVSGLLLLGDPAPGRFTDALIDFLDGAAEQIAIALEQKTKLSSLEVGLRRIAALVAEIGGGPQKPRTALPSALRASLDTLSPREADVLRLLLHNRRPVAIAKDLSRSVHTVRNQLKAIFRKLKVHSQEELLDRLGTSADLICVASTPRRRSRRPSPSRH